MRDSNLSVIIFVEARDALMSCTQAISSYLSNNTLRERVLISYPRHVLCSVSWTYPEILQIERGSSLFRGSEDFSGMNMVCMTNKAAFVA